MKALKATAVLLFLFSAGGFLAAEESNEAQVINTEVVIMAVSKEMAFHLMSQHNFNAYTDDGFRKLQLLVQKKQAQVAANVSVTSVNGQHATNEAGTTTLEVEPMRHPLADVIDLNLVLNYQGRKLATSMAVTNGVVKFIGAFDPADNEKNVTCLAFVLARVSMHFPDVTKMFDLSIARNRKSAGNTKPQTLPVIIALKNKLQEDAIIEIYEGDNNGVLFDPVDDGGNPIPTPRSYLSHRIVPLVVKPGKTAFLKAALPLEIFDKNKRIVASLNVVKRSASFLEYRVYSKPFTLADLK